MKILYISALSSERLVSDIHQKTGHDPGFAVQKFSRLIVKGLMANDIDVKALTILPIMRDYSSKLFEFHGTELENGITYKYAPIINLPFVKQLCSFIYIFFYVLFWGFGNRRGKAIICDVLNVSASIGSLLASRINRVQSVGVVTDIYGFMVDRRNSTRSMMNFIACRLNGMYVSAFDKYVLLTEQMNNLVNPKDSPHIVMEALCDSSILDEKPSEEKIKSTKTMLYAGGLHVKYGLKMLVNAFLQSGVNGKLIIYGDGPYTEDLRKICAISDKVEYRGLAANEEVVEAEHQASVLVNPRFTTEVFSPYSFPSKNMEYMASGTPLLTTNLPGMPKEYHQYVYLFGEETEEAYAEAIRQIFAKSDDELKQMGARAKKFVLKNKNNVAQAKRIVDLITR